MTVRSRVVFSLLVLLPAEGAAEAAPHPEPRVIVDVHSVHGPHSKSEVQRAARLGWGRIVSCYKASEKQKRGSIAFDLDIARSGKAIGARRAKSTFNKKLTRCLLGAMQKLPMPSARRGSTARIEIRLAPGDPPTQ